MKKSVNFNSRKSQLKKYCNTKSFVNLAKWVGISDKEVVDSVKKINTMK